MQKRKNKSDVYNYGVVLLEIISGKKPLDPSFGEEVQHITQWVREQIDLLEIIDAILNHNQDDRQTLEISFLCTTNRGENRPTKKDVLVLLRKVRIGQRNVAH